ncbi:hypothetical protein ACJX0J_020692, partial [Zea mays]
EQGKAHANRVNTGGIHRFQTLVTIYGCVVCHELVYYLFELIFLIFFLSFSLLVDLFISFMAAKTCPLVQVSTPNSKNLLSTVIKMVCCFFYHNLPDAGSSHGTS